MKAIPSKLGFYCWCGETRPTCYHITVGMTERTICDLCYATVFGVPDFEVFDRLADRAHLPAVAAHLRKFGEELRAADAVRRLERSS